MFFERQGDARGGSDRGTGRVDQNRNGLANGPSKHIVDIVSVEVGAPAEDFEVEVILTVAIMSIDY